MAIYSAMVLPRILLQTSPAYSGVLAGTLRRALPSPSPFTSAACFSSTRTALTSSLRTTPATSLLLQLSRRQLPSLKMLPSRTLSRFTSTAQTGPRKLPERILIYHAGTPRTTFLACLKITTVFGLAFFTFLVAPAYIAADKPWTQTLAIIACGIVPFSVIAYTSMPFVVFIHLRLPAFARHPDPELLRRFVRNTPATTKLDITTMNLVGRPRVTSVSIGDIVPARERMRIVNFIDSRQSVLAPPVAPTSASGHPSRPVPTPPAAPKPQTNLIEFSRKFPWIHLRQATHFGAPAGNNSRSVKAGWVWEELLAGIERKAKQT